MQIAFLTLFLGLVSGSGPVAVSAGPGVAAVDLVLDGTSVTLLMHGPPWKSRVDFGPGLLPHHLVARALDGAGNEVATAEQWINLPRPPAEVEITPERAAPGAPRRVRLAWQSLTNERPIGVTLSLDGKPLTLDAQQRATLPLRPPDSPTSVLSAEVRFPGDLVVRKDVALGRDFDDAVATELTAVPVRVHQGRELPPVAGMQDWFDDGGRALRVDAVEHGLAQVMVVRDSLVPRLLAATRWQARLPHGRASVDLAPGLQMRFFSTVARAHGGPGIPSELFDSSDRYLVTGERQAATLLENVIDPNEPSGGPQRRADAVAVAGLRAYATGRPRAVLVVLRRDVHDASRYGAAAVRRYLAAIGVPLFVWSLGTPGAADVAAWGTIEDFSTPSGLDRGFLALKQALDAQRIVWVEGRHLPQAIALGPAAAGFVELAPPS